MGRPSRGDPSTSFVACVQADEKAEEALEVTRFGEVLRIEEGQRESMSRGMKWVAKVELGSELLLPISRPGRRTESFSIAEFRAYPQVAEEALREMSAVTPTLKTIALREVVCARRRSEMVDPEVTLVLGNLAEIATRNTAAAIQTRISASRASKQKDEAITQLVEIVNELLDDKTQLLTIARALEGQVLAQRISPDDIAFITETLIPALESILRQSGTDAVEQLEMLKAIISVETLTVLQMIGFNFKAAIGEPLTEVVKGYVRKLAPRQDSSGRTAAPVKKR